MKEREREEDAFSLAPTYNTTVIFILEVRHETLDFKPWTSDLLIILSTPIYGLTFEIRELVILKPGAPATLKILQFVSNL